MLVEEDRLISVGNFDVLPLAACLDYLRIALAPLLTSAYERLEKMLQEPYTGLPQNLAARAGGVDLALSELGLIGQALVAEARLLAGPVSFEVTGSSRDGGLTDRITMAPLAGRRVARWWRSASVSSPPSSSSRRRRSTFGAFRTRPRHAAAVRPRARAGRFTEEGEAPPRDIEGVLRLVRSGALASLA